MKKLILSFVAAMAVALLWSASAYATVGDTHTVDGITYKVLTESGSTGTVQVGNDTLAIAQNTTGSITIPSTVTNGGITYTVTSIGDDAFSYCAGLTSVTIPSSVTSIGNSAFFACGGLTSVTIPSGVTSIGNSAFGVCGLTSVTIPSGVTSIGNNAFMGCGGLTSVTIPNGVESIGNQAFQSCDRLTSVTIPSSVTSIGSEAFSFCSALTSVTIPSSVTSIGAQAFWNCSALTDITLHIVDDYTLSDVAKINDQTIDTEGGKKITKVTGEGGKTLTNSSGASIAAEHFGKTYTVAAGAGFYFFMAYDVTFDSNGGSSVASLTKVKESSKITKPTDPTRNGYTFGGWYKDSAFATAWDFDKDTVTANVTLYAKWNAIPADKPNIPAPVQTNAPAPKVESAPTSTPAPTPAPENVIANIASQINNATGSGTVVIPMASANLPTNLLNAAKGKDIDLILDFGTHSITISGTSVKDLPKAQQTVDLSAKAISTKALTELSDGKSVKQLEFKQKGEFPFELGLTLWVGNKYNGQTLRLSIYDKDNNLLEEVDAAEVSKGKVTFTVPSGGRYVITKE